MIDGAHLPVSCNSEYLTIHPLLPSTRGRKPGTQVLSFVPTLQGHGPTNVNKY